VKKVSKKFIIFVLGLWTDIAQEEFQFMDKGPKVVIPPLINNNLFQITMLVLDEDYQSNYIDFLLAAFKVFIWCHGSLQYHDQDNMFKSQY